ncbi:MAG TPA: hypothetical protein HA370_01405, partial [Nanoarchaeota archaeon]|nr:hypothetical protein [Nanoarchaeota archaeon]
MLGQIPEIVKSHSNFKKEADYNSETGFRFILDHKDDEDREKYPILSERDNIIVIADEAHRS